MPKSKLKKKSFSESSEKKMLGGFLNFFGRIFKPQKPTPLSLRLPETLPESIEEINKIVDNLSAQIREFSKENENLSARILDAAKTNKILIIITILSAAVNIVLILKLF